MKTYTVDVTQTVQVTFDDTKFTPEFFAEYNSYITYLGGDDGDTENALRQHAENLAWMHATGVARLDFPIMNPFVEGYGPVNDMGIEAVTTDTETVVTS
jgi:hypothetical protein